MRCGDTVYMHANGTPCPHLWVLITDPQPQTALGIIISITTLRNRQDQTVIVGPSDHPYLQHPSVVFYGDSRIVDTRAIERAVLEGTVQSQERCSPNLLSLLQGGVLASPHTPKKIIRFYRDAIAEGSGQ